MSYGDYLLNAVLVLGFLVGVFGAIWTFSVGVTDVNWRWFVGGTIPLLLLAVYSFATLAYRGDVGLL